jgi:homoserine O-acetyltransferase
MNSHDVTRGRGDLRTALAALKSRLVVAAVDSDRLYPPALSTQLVAAYPAVDGVHTITSPYGHDGFLIELDQVGALIARSLRVSSPSRP